MGWDGDIHRSSNINEVIRVISSLFYEEIQQAKKAQNRIRHS